MTATPHPRCDACRFFVKTMGSMEGQCRRYPPVPLSSMHSYFSEVSQSHWCGEFQARDVATPMPTVEAKGRSRKDGR